jgi:hypothetical protein
VLTSPSYQTVDGGRVSTRPASFHCFTACNVRSSSHWWILSLQHSSCPSLPIHMYVLIKIDVLQILRIVSFLIMLVCNESDIRSNVTFTFIPYFPSEATEPICTVAQAVFLLSPSKWFLGSDPKYNVLKHLAPSSTCF